MSLQAGSHVGIYEVLGLVGSGGMGEVYAARDTKLNRRVALKILPDGLARDADRLQRLRREAQVLAALNHPHIAQIYGIDDSTGTPVLAMEFVEGPTLAERLTAGGALRALPVEDAIAIARQIAEGLEGAHEAGIVHRDLKPANIKIRPDGTVKLLDFGLAKALESDGPAADAARSPVLATVTSPAVTHIGVILGTAAYMAPEQARGMAVDKRADIWAFGCVFWEMLTGRRLFGRETMPETIAAVMKDAPPMDALPPATPSAVRRLISRCLERDPSLRLRDIGEARIALSSPLDDAGPQPPARTRRGTALAVLGSIALAAAAGTIAWRFSPRSSVPFRKLELAAPVGSAREARISPDGARVAYIAEGHLYIRALASVDSQDLGTVPPSAANLFWSPDGRTIGFTAAQSIQTIPSAGGAPFTICRIPGTGRLLDIQWLPDGRIAFSVWRDNLYVVASTGGPPLVLLAMDPAQEIDFHEFCALPGGRFLVNIHARADDGLVVTVVEGRQRTKVTVDFMVGRLHYSGGWLVFARRGSNSGVWTAPFDGRTLDLSRAVMIQSGAVTFDAAEDGTMLAGMPLNPQSSLGWVDRSGSIVALPGPSIESPRSFVLSPKGDRAAYIAGPPSTPNLFVRVLASGVETPLTFNRGDDVAPANYPNQVAWSPDGATLLVARGNTEAAVLVAQRIDSAAGARELVKGTAGQFSADGRTLLFLADDRGRRSLRRAPATEDLRIGTPERVFRGEDDPNVLDFSLSPDGRLLAYAATQPDGRAAVFMTNLPETTGRWIVTDGGRRPQFTPDGRELIYARGSVDDRGRPFGRLMAATVTLTPGVTLGAPVELLSNERPNAPLVGDFAIAADGRRFLMVLPPQSGTGNRRLILLQNWRALIEQ